VPIGVICDDVGTITQTDLGYTGQRDIAGMGLMDYKARFYDSNIGRFIQPDTIIPNPADPQGWNRYAYVKNTPIRFNDPSGHRICDDVSPGGQCFNPDDPSTHNWNSYAKRVRGKSQNPTGWPSDWPALSSLLFSATRAANPTQAQKTLLLWWYSNGPMTVMYGPGSDMARELQASNSLGGVREMRQKYTHELHQTGIAPTLWGSRSTGLSVEGFVNTGADTLKYIFGSHSEPFLGTYSIQVGPVDRANPYRVQITIRNQTNMESGTRLSLLLNELGGPGTSLFGPYVEDPYGWSYEHGNGFPMNQTIYWYENLSP
jgi:RHS repeat-associated protein